MSQPAVSAYPPAGLDRRFYAFAIDRLVAWPITGLAVYLAWRLFFRDGSTVAGIALIIGVVLLVGLVFSLMLGLQGSSPGKSLMGLRVVRHDGGTPIGIGPAMLRTLVLGVAALPTFGLGVATLAQTAVMDRNRQRRGWHDHLSHGVVVDVRPVEERTDAPVAGPQQVVNLTAMRLAPAPAQPAQPTPPRRATPAQPTGEIVLPPGAPPGRTPLPPGPPPGWQPPTPAPTPPPTATPAPTDEPVGTRPRPPAEESAGERTVVRGGSGKHARAAAGWRVTFDTGESFLVEGLGLVGRRPEGRPGEPVRHLVPLPSQDMSLSKTHAQFQVAADGVLVVMDRGSTNGSMLVRSGVARELPAGKATTLVAGDLVRFGDRTMTVAQES